MVVTLLACDRVSLVSCITRSRQPFAHTADLHHFVNEGYKHNDAEKRVDCRCFGCHLGCAGRSAIDDGRETR